jgi:poly-gamma-glutamate synthesis protein (capsule biosynthesis protein)
MKSEKKLSLKDRITIQIKQARPLHWGVYLGVAVVLLAVLLGMGVSANQKVPVTVPAALTTTENQVRISVLGDIAVTDNLRVLANKTSYTHLLQNVKSYWSGSDQVIASVSGPVLTYDVSNYTSTRDQGEDSVYLRPAALRSLMNAGITLLNFATDDAYNYGTTGIESTLRNLQSYSANYVGIAASNQEPLYQMLTFETDSGTDHAQTRGVAVFGINDVIINRSTVRESRAGVVNSSIETIFESVYSAAQTADLTVVYLHAGESGSQSTTDDQQLLARALIDAGADIVVGNHAHTVQPMERYGDGVILYSLGDLFSDAELSTLLDSAMLDIVVTEAGETNLYVTPLHISDGMPQIAAGAYQSRILKVLTSGMEEGTYQITEDGQVVISLGQLEETSAYQAFLDSAASAEDDAAAQVEATESNVEE